MKKKIKWILILILFVFTSTGCYPGITATVVDSETGKPIEGAVVMVEWTKKVGFPGLTNTESYKVVEVITDKEGKAKISGVYNPLVDPPDVAVYKRGYVAWSSSLIFPGPKLREDFKWGDQVFKLERFKPEYSYIEHTSFIGRAASLSFGNKKLINEAVRWEELEASKERDRRRRKR